jgi:hypothetical protein
LNKKYINSLNISITSNEFVIVIKNFPTNKKSDPDGVTAKFYKSINEELTPMLPQTIP